MVEKDPKAAEKEKSVEKESKKEKEKDTLPIDTEESDERDKQVRFSFKVFKTFNVRRS